MNITTSKAVRLQMMEMCDKHFSWDIDGENTLIHRYTTEDGKVEYYVMLDDSKILYELTGGAALFEAMEADFASSPLKSFSVVTCILPERKPDLPHLGRVL